MARAVADSGTDQIPQTTQAPEVAERLCTPEVHSLGVTGEANCLPSKSRPGWLSEHLFLSRKATSGFLHRKGAFTRRRWPVVRRGSGDFLLRVHLVLRLVVPKTAYGFCRFEYEIATSRWYPGKFLHKKV